jgi:hypothetical protein
LKKANEQTAAKFEHKSIRIALAKRPQLSLKR